VNPLGWKFAARLSRNPFLRILSLTVGPEKFEFPHNACNLGSQFLSWRSITLSLDSLPHKMRHHTVGQVAIFYHHAHRVANSCVRQTRMWYGLATWEDLGSVWIFFLAGP